MKFTRKGFFKTILGSFVAAPIAPLLIKAEENSQKPEDLSLGREVLRVDERGSVGIGGGSGYLGLGTNTPNHPLHVSSIIFHVNNRRLEMSGDENGDFKIQWLDVKENETSCSIAIQQPKVDPWKINLNQIN
jgi:hypothetical protein